MDTFDVIITVLIFAIFFIVINLIYKHRSKQDRSKSKKNPHHKKKII